MIYKDDAIVTTQDGRKHRVLWPTKRDENNQHLELRVKAVGKKHRGSYTIDTSKITKVDDK